MVQDARQASEQMHPVCVIEDNESLRWLVRIALEEAGYRVREAGDGLSGYALLRDAAEPAIALVDQILPRMDGCELLERLAREERAHARRHAFILVTGSEYLAEHDCGKASGELDIAVVLKPFTLTQLLEAVAAAAARLPVS
jgi:two-component system, chemotaxis family, chemotaxis protein CheY